MNNTNTAIYDTAVDRAAMLRLYEKNTVDKIELVIDGHAIRVDDLIKKSKMKGLGFDSFLKLLDTEITFTMGENYKLSASALGALVTDQISFTASNLSSQLGSFWKTERPPRQVSEDFVLKKPLIGDKTLSVGWADLGKNERIRLEALLRKGISDGLDENALAELVSKDKTFELTKSKARGLVVTAMTSVYSQADQAVYAANKDALLGWQYIAVLDSRTTFTCAHRNGKIYPPEDTEHLPPAHWNCRSHTIPIVKNYDSLMKLEGIAQIRKRNLEGLSETQKAKYDGLTPLRESYDSWLRRQPEEIQLKHLGDYKRLQLFLENKLTADKFTNASGRSVGIKGLRKITNSAESVSGDTRKFANAKEKLDAIKLGASRPEDFYNDSTLQDNLKEYFKVQAGELDGTLSLLNYRGTLINVKSATKKRVINSPPTDANLVFNPLTKRYEDSRVYQPSQAAIDTAHRRVAESQKLSEKDKEFILAFSEKLSDSMGMNHRAAVVENLRTTFGRYRDNPEPWVNFKAVTQSQIKFDVMNVSDVIETALRSDSDVLKKLKLQGYIDPVLGPVQLQELHDSFKDNIKARNKWEDSDLPKIASKLRGLIDTKIPLKLRVRLSDTDLENFYMSYARRLSLADAPDRDQVAVAIGRDLYNAANYRGTRNQWFETGKKLLEDAQGKGLFDLDTYGVQKRRMRSRMGGNYFGPYYDTLSVNIKITDPKILEYAKLNRKIDLGFRIGSVDTDNQLVVREGYKTYFIDDGKFGMYDTRIPLVSTHSFSDLPTEVINKNMAEALNWASSARYKVDKDFFNFTSKLLNFKDDKGRSEHYDSLNTYRAYISSRGDAYERFKAMEWHVEKGSAFGNTAFIDHRGRIYDAGLIGPQSGETFRPFLNTEKPKKFSQEAFYNFQDQIGGFLGGLNDVFEDRFNSLSVTGRQRIAEYWRKDLVAIGNAMLRAKPNDIRFVLDSKMLAQIDGEDQGKFLRLAMESAKLDNYLKEASIKSGVPNIYSAENLSNLKNYETSLALEQDASSSGAQIIALTTKNRQLAELSNVVQTVQKRRLYDEIAESTFRDPRFIELNKRLGLTEKDLRKAAKAQNMVTLYGAGERTGILNVENKLGKVLEKADNTLVVKASDRDTVLSEISARAARYEKIDPELSDQLKALRQDVRDVFNKGLKPSLELMDELYFLDPKTADLVEKMTRTYDNVVTPDDFKLIANIMSENLASQVPILKDFTRYCGRLARDFLLEAKPKASALDVSSYLKTKLFGEYESGKRLPKWLSKIMGIKDESIREKLLNRIPGYVPGSLVSQVIMGVKAPTRRRTGFKIGDFSIFSEDIVKGIEIGIPNRLDKNWVNVPWVNFDGTVLEQNFTQTFEEKLSYKNPDGTWVNNILQIPQKTAPTAWEEFRNKSNKINDIADVNKAVTAFGVNGNHSNDATLVKNFHLWGKRSNIRTSTIHDAFFTNAADMLVARNALKQIYAETLKKNSIKATLDEMKARGLPDELYKKYLDEAIDLGLIPIAGRSKVGGKVLEEKDILKPEDLSEKLEHTFSKDRYWYGVG